MMLLLYVAIGVVAYVVALLFWLSEFGSDTEDVMVGSVWALFPATIWPVVLVLLLFGLGVLRLIRALEERVDV